MAQRVVQALVLLQNETTMPALALINVDLPQINGYQLATQLRAQNRSANVPIIFLSSRACCEADVLYGYQLGAVDFLIRPSNDVLLRSKVQLFIQAHLVGQ